VTVLLTLVTFYGVFMETDYGKALFFTYDELWDAAERQEAAGNSREAERLLRHIVVMEENRVTMRFGLFVLFAGPQYLVRAKLRLAELYWHKGRLQEADQGYRDTLEKIVKISGQETWTYPMAELKYSEFLVATGQEGTARQHLALAQQSADLVAHKFYWPWQDYEGSHQPYVRELGGQIAALRAQLDARTKP
jgi:hypothetical protein